MRYPSVLTVLVVAFSDLAYTCTKLEAPLTPAVVPLIQFRKIGGADDRNAHIDLSRVDVNVFHSTDDDAEELAEFVRDRLTSDDVVLESDGVYLDYIETEVAPVWIPYPEDIVTHYRATYRITTRPV